MLCDTVHGRPQGARHAIGSTQRTSCPAPTHMVTAGPLQWRDRIPPCRVIEVAQLWTLLEAEHKKAVKEPQQP